MLPSLSLPLESDACVLSKRPCRQAMESDPSRGIVSASDGEDPWFGNNTILQVVMTESLDGRNFEVDCRVRRSRDLADGSSPLSGSHLSIVVSVAPAIPCSLERSPWAVEGQGRGPPAMLALGSSHGGHSTESAPPLPSSSRAPCPRAPETAGAGGGACIIQT